MYGICHNRPVSVGLDSQIWYLFIYITGYLNVRKISETMDFRTFVGPLGILQVILPPRCEKFCSSVKQLTEKIGFRTHINQRIILYANMEFPSCAKKVNLRPKAFDITLTC